MCALRERFEYEALRAVKSAALDKVYARSF